MFKVGDKVECTVLSWEYPSIYQYEIGAVYEMTVSNDSLDVEFTGPYGGSFDMLSDSCRVEVFQQQSGMTVFDIAYSLQQQAKKGPNLFTNTKMMKENKILTLPTDSDARKEIPMFSGCIKYFPAAISGIARISKKGNDKHNPGQELHHDRTKSLDHADCILRHLTDVADLIAALERGENTNPEMILAEVSSLAWRALAYSQTLHEKYDGAPLAPGAKLNK